MTSPQHFRGTIAKALNVLQEKFGPQPPDFCVVLGSGLGVFADRLSDSKEISYQDIPDFPTPKVAGHAGKCLAGRIGDKRLLVFCGRFHYYEGHSPSIVTLPVRVAGTWGTKRLIVTNAAGSLQKKWGPGTLMLIRDHINLMGQNPLRGPNLDELGPRFVDMTQAYDPEYRKNATKLAKNMNLSLQEGVYAAFSGPTYETPAEIHMMQTLGADTVGMSTVPEVIVARQQGMRVLGIACITNFAAGIEGAGPIHHEEVLETTKKSEKQFCEFLTEWIKQSEI